MANVSGGASKSSSCSNLNDQNNDDNCNGESKTQDEHKPSGSLIPKHSILKSSVFGSSLLDSPGLDSSSPRSKPFVLNPPKLSNPFMKVDNKEEYSLSSSSPASQTESKAAAPATPNSKSNVSFVPLGGEASTPSQQPSSFSAASTPSLGFVFGQNIHEKVEAATPDESPREAAEPTPTKKAPEVTANGTSSEMLFSVIVPKENADKSSDGGKSLSEAAREYEEARAVKRKFEEVPILTGEEEEANVLQINCKLFSFSNCTWLERGRGTLRVNDLPTSPGIHRLIVRTAGNFRVVLNTKIWSEMIVDRASNKSLRITAMDSNGVVKIFVVMASPKEIDQLQKCLEWRINNLKKNEDSPPKKVRPEDS